MRTFSFVLLTLFSLSSLIAQDQQPIRGGYGKNDVRIRAGNGSIEEARLKKFDFAKTQLSKIAVIYWSDGVIGTKKLGLTVFQNKTEASASQVEFQAFCDSVVTAQFEQVETLSFTKIATPAQVEKYFVRNRLGSKVKVQSAGTAYLAALKKQGYDGLLILFEEEFQDLISGSSAWLPSKGLYKYGKKELVYASLYSTLIRTDDQKTVKNIGYKQLSGDYSAVPFAGLKSLSPEQEMMIIKELKGRFTNNIEEILRVHKLK